MSAPVKLVLTWDIKQGQEKSYFTYMQEFSTALQQAGLELSDAWYTLYGPWPQISMGFVSEDLRLVESFLVSEVWLRTKHRLLSYIQGYRQKVVPARSGFQV